MSTAKQLTEIEQRIQRTHQTVVESDPLRLNYYERGALLELERMGFSTVRESDGATGELRNRAWLAETIVYTIDSLREGDNLSALRGLLQLAVYKERHPSVLGTDAYFELKNQVEEKLKAR